jgi:uncharacterized protein YdhG (YjbR/CyaY superfamily)
MADTAFKTIDEYIAQFPPEIGVRLNTIRETIRSAAPDATEKISWQMPTFYLYGNLIHFAAFKKHISIFPGEEGVAHFIDQLRELHYSKGGIQFPNDAPLPLELVTKIVLFRAEQNRAAAAAKKPPSKKASSKTTPAP